MLNCGIREFGNPTDLILKKTLIRFRKNLSIKKKTQKMSNFHEPVLLKEAIAGLRVEKNKKYIDATLGGGGHTIEILQRGGIVLGLDVDREAIEYVQERIKNLELRIKNKLKL